jgi:hypothetical protein
MRRVITPLLASFALAGTLCFADEPAPAWSPGLLTNASFEQWEGESLTGWSVTVHRRSRQGSPVTVRGVEQPAPQEGQKSLAFTFSDWSAVSLRQTLQHDGAAGAKYRLEGYARTSEDFDGAVWVALASRGGMALNAGKHECRINSPQAVNIPLTAEWAKFSVELTWEDASQHDLALIVNARAPGIVWLDRLSLVEEK